MFLLHLCKFKEFIQLHDQILDSLQTLKKYLKL